MRQPGKGTAGRRSGVTRVQVPSQRPSATSLARTWWARWASPAPSVPSNATRSLCTAKGWSGSRLGRRCRVAGLTTMKAEPRRTRQRPCMVSEGRTFRPLRVFTGVLGQLMPSRKGWKRRSACSWASPASSITATRKGRRACSCSAVASPRSTRTTAAWPFSASGTAACGFSPRSTAGQGSASSSSGCLPAPIRRARSSPVTASVQAPPRACQCSTSTRARATQPSPDRRSVCTRRRRWGGIGVRVG